MRLYNIVFFLVLLFMIASLQGCRNNEGDKTSETDKQAVEQQQGFTESQIEVGPKPYDDEAEKAGEASKARARRVKALVDNSIDYLSVNGLERTIDAINNPQNPDHKKFIDGEYYIWVFRTDYSSKAWVVGHAVNITVTEKEWFFVKDPDGKTFIQDIIRMSKFKDDGWVLYKWAHPKHKRAARKVTYFKKSGDLVFMNGFYLE